MNKFAIQRVYDGSYVAPDPDTLVQDPKKAYLFATQQAARQYISERLPMLDWSRWAVAILPSTRDLL